MAWNLTADLPFCRLLSNVLSHLPCAVADVAAVARLTTYTLDATEAAGQGNRGHAVKERWESWEIFTCLVTDFRFIHLKF